MDRRGPPRPRRGDGDLASLPRPAEEARLTAIARRDLRQWLLGAAALAAGIAIGYVDSRPGWDDTGVTAGLLLVVATAAAALDGRRPWLWALLAGAPLAIIEVPTSGSLAPLAGLAFAAVGAAIGWLARRLIGEERRG